MHYVSLMSISLSVTAKMTLEKLVITQNSIQQVCETMEQN